MVKLVVDTCVWLDIAKDHKQQSIIMVLDELIEDGLVELIIPEIIIDEFDRNKDRILQGVKTSYHSVLQRVKELVREFGEEEEKSKVIEHLSNIQHKSPLLGEYAAQGSFNWISTLLENAKIKKTTNAIKLKAAERAINKIAPFHRAKNNMADAIILETYLDQITQSTVIGDRFIFVTHNTTDFSLVDGNLKLPHADLKRYFSKRKSRYFISLSEALNSVKPNLVSKLLVEREDFDRNPRTLTQILESEDELTTKIWYNRHQIRREKIDDGSITIIDDADFETKSAQTTITKSIWKGARKNAKKVEKRFGKENLSWDDFEWGMLNGKLSALRWVLGEDWDELYT
jgi:hypothetical protein